MPVFHSHQQRKFQVSSYNKIPKGGKALEESIVVAAAARQSVVERSVFIKTKEQVKWALPAQSAKLMTDQGRRQFLWVKSQFL